MTPLLALLLKVGFGALAGGVTNTLAVWMLFHPYRPPKLFGRWELTFLHGAIPKSQPRLAKTVGAMVGGKLLTPEDLAAIFAEGPFRQAFDSRLAQVIDSALNARHGSVRELVPTQVADDLEAMLEEVGSKVAAGLQGYIGSEAFEREVLERTLTVSREASSVPLGGFLTHRRAHSLRRVAGAVFEDTVASDGLEATVSRYVEAAARDLVESGRTFEDALPHGLVHPVERVIAAYLPLAAGRLDGLLDDHSVRKRIESTISDLLERFLDDLRFPKRVMARLFVNEQTVERVVDAIRTQGSVEMAGIFRDITVQRAISRGIREGVSDLLRRPIGEVVGRAGTPAVIEARDSLTQWLVELVRRPSARKHLDECLLAGVNRLGEKTWGEVLEYLPPEKIAGSIVEMARSEGARRQLDRTVRGVVTGLLDRPVGVPARWLPDDAARRIENAIGNPLWEWLQTQIPSAVERINIAKRVETKVVQFPMSRVEMLIREVSKREIRLIIRLGFLLGGVVGATLALVETLIG